MPVELHLPDLPEVPIALGPARGRAPRPPMPWHLRLRDLVSSYLPLLLMALLALFTWWLVKNSPVAPPALEPKVLRHDPDYTMEQFSIERFEPGGRLEARLAGSTMRHFPDSDRIEADDVRLRAIAPDGRITVARAQRAISNGDGSEIQLYGDAHVVSGEGGPDPIEMSGEFLQLYVVAERVHSPLPITVLQGGAQI
ncbi:MAG: LPS export ABC transporter periplasmic protein LptC, partial [Burkholderiales bacterium]|nr:LPS export ABC transporter periplasmic protein LptC [Burkholderiales bacterium]